MDQSVDLLNADNENADNENAEKENAEQEAPGPDDSSVPTLPAAAIA
jgi:hypothetical protein